MLYKSFILQKSQFFCTFTHRLIRFMAQRYNILYYLPNKTAIKFNILY